MNYTYYKPSDIIKILENHDAVFCKQGEKEITYTLNEPISFDIESTSTYISNESGGKQKFAFMYVWAFDIFDCTIIGRTWQEFTNMCEIISKFYKLNDNRKIIVYVHNLGFDFTFFQYLFNWKHVFATEPRKPIYAICDLGIEFRCSYRLTGYSLEMIGKQCGIEKLKGDLDYAKVRHQKTILKPDEIKYIIHDVKIVSECIRRKIKEENGIIFIPLTKTGYVRRLFRWRCLHDKKYLVEYMELIKRCKMTLPEYKIAKQAFCGGFTHANPYNSAKIKNDVVSYDICSSYPTSLICYKYPSSSGKLYYFNSIDHLQKEMYNDDCVYILQIELRNVTAKFTQDNYISYSKCLEVDRAVKNNGRIVSAERLVISITNIDFQIIEKWYNFEIVAYANCYRYDIDYLPEPFIRTLLELYAKKTSLKDIEGMEKEYLSSKENINAAFGMMVMNIVRDMVDFDKEWEINGAPQGERKALNDEEMQEQLDEENKKRGRFLFYVWGIFCTAYSRRRLANAIFECGNGYNQNSGVGDYIYSDTDSVKFTNEEKHKKYFENANKEIIKQIEHVLKLYNIPLDMYRPKTKEGIEKPLGIWEFDGHYEHFKTIGAKRYFMKYSEDLRNKKKERGKYKLTVAGLSKKDALEYILKQDKPFDFFRNGMKIPEENTGKMTHTYIDYIMQSPITDYNGMTISVISLSGVHLSPQDYHCTLARDYANFLQGKHDFFSR